MLLKTLAWLDRNVEKTIIVTSYSVMASIVFIEVIRRFMFKVQAPWSTSLPVYMFLFVAWLGAAYNVKTRTHLSFSELRWKLPYKGQFFTQILDALCWYIFSIIVIYYSIEQVCLAYDNSAIVYGTDDLMQWYFFSVTPISWCLIIIRATQNLFSDIQKYNSKRPFKEDTSLGR